MSEAPHTTRRWFVMVGTIGIVLATLGGLGWARSRDVITEAELHAADVRFAAIPEPEGCHETIRRGDWWPGRPAPEPPPPRALGGACADVARPLWLEGVYGQNPAPSWTYHSREHAVLFQEPTLEDDDLSRRVAEVVAACREPVLRADTHPHAWMGFESFAAGLVLRDTQVRAAETLPPGSDVELAEAPEEGPAAPSRADVAQANAEALLTLLEQLAEPSDCDRLGTWVDRQTPLWIAFSSLWATETPTDPQRLGRMMTEHEARQSTRLSFEIELLAAHPAHASDAGFNGGIRAAALTGLLEQVRERCDIDDSIVRCYDRLDPPPEPAPEWQYTLLGARALRDVIYAEETEPFFQRLFRGMSAEEELRNFWRVADVLIELVTRRADGQCPDDGIEIERDGVLIAVSSLEPSVFLLSAPQGTAEMTFLCPAPPADDGVL